MSTQIGDLKVDPPVDMSTIGTRDDRQYLDQQARGAQQHLVQSLIKGVHCSWFTVDDALVGTVAQYFAYAATGVNSNGEVTVVPVTSTTLAPHTIGVALTTGVARTKVLLAMEGCLPPAQHGLVNGGVAGYAKVNTTTGALQFVTGISAADTIIGRVTAANVLTLYGANINSTLNAPDNTQSSATGTSNTFQGQNATGTASFGGDVIIAAGTGTSRPGRVELIGPLVIGRFAQAMADANQTVSGPNSAANIFDVSGACTAARTLTISRVPTAGAVFFVNNLTTGGFALNVKFVFGSTFSIPAGKSAIIYADGTNASGITITT